MKYIITESQLDTVLGKFNPNDFKYYQNLAEPFKYKRQFLKKYPKEYYLAVKAGILDDLKEWGKSDTLKNYKPKK